MAVQAGAQIAPVLNLATPPLDERSKYLRRLVIRTLHGGERGHEHPGNGPSHAGRSSGVR